MSAKRYVIRYVTKSPFDKHIRMSHGVHTYIFNEYDEEVGYYNQVGEITHVTPRIWSDEMKAKRVQVGGAP